MNKCIEIPLVLGLSAGLLVGEAFGESKLPHGEYVAVSPTPMPNVAAAAAKTIALVVNRTHENITPVESRIPQDHLIVNTTGLVLSGNRRD
jgi:hypothetical protein